MIPTSLNPLGAKRKSFITTWEVAAGETIYLPFNNYNMDIYIDWGDGTLEHITDSTQNSHTYTNAGNYHISIRGYLGFWNFNTVGNSRANLRAINNWGDVGWENLNFVIFDSGCQSIPNGAPNVPGGDARTAYAFHGSDLRKIPKYALRGCTNLTGYQYEFARLYRLTDKNIPVELFRDCINLTGAKKMFYGTNLSGGIIPALLFNPAIQPNIGDFTNAFTACHITGNVPRLWELYPDALHSNCFTGNEDAANWNDIPNDWKGL